MTNLEHLLSFDALEAAETITGKRVDNDTETFGLGFTLLHAKSMQLETALRARQDVYSGCETAYFREVIERECFDLLIEDQFDSDNGRDTLFIYGHADGLILSFDTYGPRVNGGNLYFNWHSQEASQWPPANCSGSVVGPGDGVWSGGFDCREALIFNLERLRLAGEFVRPWVERPHLWLLHHGDTWAPGYDADAINEARIARLPQWARDFLGAPA